MSHGRRKAASPGHPFRVTPPGGRNVSKARGDLLQARRETEHCASALVVAVDGCRMAGMSWAQIGRALEISGAAAYQRYRSKVRY